MDREHRFHELDAEIENWSEDEKHFALWLLLRDVHDARGKEIPETIDTIDDYRKERFNHGLCVDCNELIDILAFELWR